MTSVLLRVLQYCQQVISSLFALAGKQAGVVKLEVVSFGEHDELTFGENILKMAGLAGPPNRLGPNLELVAGRLVDFGWKIFAFGANHYLFTSFHILINSTSVKLPLLTEIYFLPCIICLLGPRF